MLKVSSISSRHSQAHRSRERLSGLVRSTTESGILLRAMENESANAVVRIETVTTSARAIENPSAVVEPANKRIKVESVDNSATISTMKTASEQLNGSHEGFQSTSLDRSPAPTQNPESGESSIVTSSSQSSHASASNASLQDAHGQAPLPAHSPVPNSTAESTCCAPTSPANAPSQQKATTMNQIRAKYMGELEYMLREFRKLERQLLGAKGAAQLEESAGSRERREKLHSFILHLEDTVRQIEVGCALEDEGTIPGAASVNAPLNTGLEQHTHDSTIAPSVPGDSTKDKGEDESVKKLEEHILANLLPVKIRLKKQLAAQQGATRNPPGMPAPRRGSLQPTTLGKGTFAAAAEERRKQAEAARLAAQQQEEHATRRASDPSQFGKPLGGGGSSLTQKLHGATLGSKQRTQGHGVGSASAPTATGESTTPDRKILYAGMVPQSKQHQSSIIAASGVHDLIVEDPNFMDKSEEIGDSDVANVPAAQVVISQAASVVEATTEPKSPLVTSSAGENEQSPDVPEMTIDTTDKSIKPHEDFVLSEDDRRKLRKKRRKRKLLRIARRRERERQRQLVLQQQAQAAQGSAKPAATKKKSAASKPPGKKKGPKSVEYMCALCSETYNSTCDYNPWWALSQHECPKCRKTQIPRIDISAPANAIEYHPALLAHAEENNGVGGEASSESTSVQVVHITQPSPTYKISPLGEQGFIEGMDSDSESDLSELSDGSLSEESMDSDDSEMDFQAMSQAEQAEHECFGLEYKGPVLSDDDASRLLVLMAHASTCPCRHKLTKHRDVCKSTKFMMLHVRDCPGTTSSFDVCPFPWCRKVKHLLYHLVSCIDPQSCAICSPTDLSDSLKGLAGLNEYRLKKYRQRLVAASKEIKSKGGASSNGRPMAPKAPPRKDLEQSRSPVGPSRSGSQQQRTVEAIPKPTKLTTAAQPMPGPSSSTNVPPLGTVVVAYEDHVMGNTEKSLNHEDEEIANDSDHVGQEGVDTEGHDVRNENEVGEMMLDEVEGDIGVYANVDAEIAEVLAKEEAGSGDEEVAGFVPESVETLGVSGSSETIMAMECEVATLIMEDATNLKVKGENDKTLVPMEDAPVDAVAQDPISMSSITANRSGMTPNTSVLFDPSTSQISLAATAFPSLPSFVLKEGPASSTCPTVEVQSFQESSTMGVKMEASVDDGTDTSVGGMEGGLSTQPSSEALKAC